MSLEIYKNGFDNLTRKNLEQKFMETLTEYEVNNAFFIDLFTEDYLQQLVLKIHPGPLHKGKTVLLNIRILKSTLPEVNSFDNGTILITTGFLASCESEYDLVKKLILEIAK
ncbi:MAG: hypothetical protein HC830_09060 [Bacteroidetes bacterium]|nr:hypothetical protein [Bacteroidota bacterium]